MLRARLAFASIIAGCGTVRDRLITTPASRDELAAPHEAVIVSCGRGLVRVYLDTLRTELLDPAPNALLAANGITLHRLPDLHFEVRHGEHARIVPGVVSEHYPMLSPDRTRFAVTESHDTDPLLVDGAPAITAPAVVVIDLATLAVRRYTVPEITTLAGWVPDGHAIFYNADSLHLLDLDSGAVAAVPEPEPAPPDEGITCAAKGRRLSIAFAGDRQRIMLETFATAAEPEHLPALGSRELVAASWGNSNVHGDLSPNMLADLAFTRSCDQFVFSFGHGVYLGDIATGKFALVMAGESVSVEAP